MTSGIFDWQEDSNSYNHLLSVYGKNFEDLIAIPLISRLDGVSFLGVTATIYGRTDSNRLAHSIAVAEQALFLAQKLELSQIERDSLVLYWLTHDIGHLPNSHVTEPLLRIFERKYKFHEALGRSRLRQDKMIKDWCLSCLQNGEQVWGNLVKLWGSEGDYKSLFSELLYCIINVDLVDGIWRSCKILAVSCPTREEIFMGFHRSRYRVAIEYDKDRIEILKRFWQSLSSIYQDFVFSIVNQAAEAMWKKALFDALNECSLDSATNLLMARDSEMIAIISKSTTASQLLSLIKQQHCLKPMWLANESIIWSSTPRFYKNIANVCDNIKKYQQFEKSVARILSSNKRKRDVEIIATHFTRYRKFYVRMGDQLHLFNPSLKELSLYFIAKKTPGLVVSGVFSWPPVSISDLNYNPTDFQSWVLPSNQIIESISNLGSL